MSSSRGASGRFAPVPKELVDLRARIGEILASIGVPRDPAEERALPPADLTAAADRVFVEIDLPGVDPEHLQVELGHRRLTVRAERARLVEGPVLVYHRLERATQAVERRFELPGPVDAARARCRLAGGVLSIELPLGGDGSSDAVRLEVESDGLRDR